MNEYRALAQQTQRVDQNKHDHYEKVSVVFAADAVVHPDAVVVKLSRAALADSAVLGFLAYVRVANVAKVVVEVLGEDLVGDFVEPLLPHDLVSRVCGRREVAEVNCENIDSNLERRVAPKCGELCVVLGELFEEDREVEGLHGKVEEDEEPGQLLGNREWLLETVLAFSNVDEHRAVL